MIRAQKIFLVLPIFFLVNFIAPLVAVRVSAAPVYFNVSKSLVKSRLIGEWEMITKVVWSDCPYVTKGESTKSKLSISDINGRIVPVWKSNDWKVVSDNEINVIDNRELRWERESALIDGSKLWYIESLNKFELSEASKMHGESIVKQYLNGEYVGSYMTVSYLSKV